MDPLTLALIAGGAQLGLGAYQALTATKPETPTYEIPFSQQAYLQQAAAALGSVPVRMPGQDIAESNIKGATSRGVSQITATGGSQSQALEGAAKLAASEQMAFRDLAKQAAQFSYQEEQRARRDYMNALQSQARQEEQMFQYNQMMPYSQELQDYMAKRGAGYSNIAGGVSSLATSYINNYYQNQMGQWMNQQSQPKSNYVQDMGNATWKQGYIGDAPTVNNANVPQWQYGGEPYQWGYQQPNYANVLGTPTDMYVSPTNPMYYQQDGYNF